MINVLKLTNVSTFDYHSTVGPCIIILQNVTKMVNDSRRGTEKFTMIHFVNCEPVLVKESLEEIERLLKC